MIDKQLELFTTIDEKKQSKCPFGLSMVNYYSKEKKGYEKRMIKASPKYQACEVNSPACYHHCQFREQKFPKFIHYNLIPNEFICTYSGELDE